MRAFELIAILRQYPSDMPVSIFRNGEFVPTAVFLEVDEDTLVPHRQYRGDPVHRIIIDGDRA